MSSSKDTATGRGPAHPDRRGIGRTVQENETGESAPTYSLRNDMGLLYTARPERRRNAGSKIQALHLM